MTNLPSGWTPTTLGQLGRYLNGRAFKKDEWAESGRPIVRIQNLTGSGKSYNYFQGEPEERHVVRTGDLLVSWAATLGVFTWEGPEAVLNQHIFKVDSHINPNFHRYLLEHSLDELRRKTHGSGMVHITRKRFDALRVGLPPLAEQQRIVEEIVRRFSLIDRSVTELETVRGRLSQLRTATMYRAITGRLVEQNPLDEPAELLIKRLLDTRRCSWEAAQEAALAAKGKDPAKGDWRVKYPEPLSIDESGLPEIPDTWQWAALEAIAEIQGGVTKDRKKEASSENVEVPYLRVANVQRGWLDLSEVKTIRVPPDTAKRLRLERGDVLFTEGGDWDKLGRGWVWSDEIEDCIHQNHVFRARLTSDEISPEFISYHGNVFGQIYFSEKGKQTTNLASINKTTLSAFPVPIPPAAEQVRILDEIARRFSIIDKAESEINSAIKNGYRLKRAVLKKAMSGDLVTQDPTDEPATLLLASIREARSKDDDR